MSGAETVMFAGSFTDLLNPDPAEIDFRALAAGLAKINRYAGATELPISVAQHTGLVVEDCTVEARPYALLHDFHEALTGDIPTPMKSAIKDAARRAAICPGDCFGGRCSGLCDLVGAIERGLDAAIHAAAGLRWPVPERIAEEVARADRAAYLTEIRDLGTEPLRHWALRTFPETDFPRLRRRVKAQNWSKAEETLSALFDRIHLEHGLTCPPLRPEPEKGAA